MAFRLVAALVADAAIAVATCGIGNGMMIAECGGTFTGRTLKALHEEKMVREVAKAIKESKKNGA